MPNFSTLIRHATATIISYLQKKVGETTFLEPTLANLVLPKIRCQHLRTPCKLGFHCLAPHIHIWHHKSFVATEVEHKQAPNACLMVLKCRDCHCPSFRKAALPSGWWPMLLQRFVAWLFSSQICLAPCNLEKIDIFTQRSSALNEISVVCLFFLFVQHFPE